MAGGFAEEAIEENIIIEPVEQEPEKEEPKNEKPKPIPHIGIEQQEPESETEEPDKITGNFVASPTNVINMVETGFSQPQIVINKGETVTWENTRTGKVNIALIIGTKLCRDIKSKILKSGEDYSYTFEKSGTCTIVDGIMTTKLMKVIVR